MYNKIQKNAHTRSKFRKALEAATRFSEDPIDERLVDRHLNIIDELLENPDIVLWVQDLSCIVRLMNTLFDRCAQCHQYKKHFLKVLNLCFFPPVLCKTTDVLEYEDDIKEFFNMFGYILARTNIYEKYKMICRGLGSMFTMTDLPIYCISNRALNQILAQSNLPFILTELVYIVQDDFYLLLVDLIQNLLQSDETCLHFIRSKLTEQLVVRLDANTAYKEEFLKLDAKAGVPVHFYQSIRILWRLAEAYHVAPLQLRTEVGVLINAEAWEPFRILFRRFVLSRVYTKERNCLLRFLCMAVRVFPQTRLSQLVNDFTLIALATEVGTAGTWAAEVQFTNDEDDFAFKIQMLSVFCYFRSFKFLGGTPLTRNILLGIFRLLMLEYELVWKISQRRKLIKYALIVLERIAPYVLQDFIYFGGPSRLLQVFENIIQGVHSVDLIIPCMTCIQSTLAPKSPVEIAKKYRSKGAIDLLLTYLKMIIVKDILTMVEQNASAIAFCILYHLNRNYECSREEIIEICLNYIKRYLNPRKDDCFLDPKVILALLDFLWENIMLSEFNKSAFLSSGGVFLLLDIVDRFPIAIKLIALSILVDLTEEGASVPFIATWRGKENCTAIALFLNVFRLGNDRNENVTKEGAIKDINFPLMGFKQMELTYKRKKHPDSSPSCLDMLANTRPKIYALLYMLYCSPKTKLVYAQYGMQKQQLSKLDEVTAILAQNYLQIKLSETWIELQRDLKRAGIRGTVFDNLIVTIHMKVGTRWSGIIKEIQNNVLRKHRQQDLLRERNLYVILKDQVLSEALDSLAEMRSNARCANKFFRRRSKQKQIDQIFKNLKYKKMYRAYHQTFASDLDVTRVFNQSTQVRSNIVIDPKQPEELALVSPTDSYDKYDKFVPDSTSCSACSTSITDFRLLPTKNIQKIP